MPKLLIQQAELDYAKFLEVHIAEAKAQLKVMQDDYDATCARFLRMLQEGAKVQRGPLTLSVELEERRKSVSWKSEFIAVRSEAEANDILAAQPITFKEVVVIEKAR
jgi:hypothetical protein